MDNIIFNKDINVQLDKVIPYNPQTGLRDSILHKYEISLSDSEKANLRQFLEVQDVHQPSSQLSDKDLIALCPSRYVSSLSDMKQLAAAMRSVVSDLDSADKPAVSSPASSVSPTEPSAPAGDSK